MCKNCRRYGNSIAECRQKQQDNQNKPQNKSFHQYMKKDQILPNKNNHTNNSSRIPLPNQSNYSRKQSHYNPNYRGRSPNKKVHKIFRKTYIVDQTVKIISIEIINQDQIQTDLSFRLIPVPIQILEKDIIQMIDLETLHIIEMQIIPTIGI